MSMYLPSVCQITDSHCGPAVVEMLLSFWGISVTQDAIVDASRTKSRVMKYGLSPIHLAKAVAILAPQYQFWFKQHTSREDIDTLLHTYHVPVGINWQGLFYDTLEEEIADFPDENLYGDHGHYSVINEIDLTHDTVTVTDTYSEYYKTPRSFSFPWFATRWWDKDVKFDRKNNRKFLLTTQQLSFIIVPKNNTFPTTLSMQLPENIPTFEPVRRLPGVDADDEQLKSHRHDLAE